MEWEWGFQVFNKYLNLHIVWLFYNVIYMPRAITNTHCIYIVESAVFHTIFHYNTEIINRHRQKWASENVGFLAALQFQFTEINIYLRSWRMLCNSDIMWSSLNWSWLSCKFSGLCSELPGRWQTGRLSIVLGKHQRDYASPSCRRVEKEERLVKEMKVVLKSISMKRKFISLIWISHFIQMVCLGTSEPNFIINPPGLTVRLWYMYNDKRKKR